MTKKNTNALLIAILTRLFFFQRMGSEFQKFYEEAIIDIITMHSIISARCESTEKYKLLYIFSMLPTWPYNEFEPLTQRL